MQKQRAPQVRLLDGRPSRAEQRGCSGHAAAQHTAPPSPRTLAVANCSLPSASTSAECIASRRVVSGSRSSVRPLSERQSKTKTHTATCSCVEWGAGRRGGGSGMAGGDIAVAAGPRRGSFLSCPLLSPQTSSGARSSTHLDVLHRHVLARPRRQHLRRRHRSKRGETQVAPDPNRRGTTSSGRPQACGQPSKEAATASAEGPQPTWKGRILPVSASNATASASSTTLRSFASEGRGERV